jgi:hypothetical protein
MSEPFPGAEPNSVPITSVRGAHVRASFQRVGEKRYGLARLGFRILLGRGWRIALLGFAYLKAVDNHVDAERDREQALAWLRERRSRLAQAYAEGMLPGEPSEIEADGLAFARYDRALGSPLRDWFEQELDVIEGDVSGRGATMSLAELEAWTIRAGRPVVLCITHFTSPRRPLPPECVDRISKAYLLADSLLDVEEDLALDVIKIPREAIERHGIRLAFPDPGIDRWLAEYGPVVVRELDDALRAIWRIPGLRTRVLAAMMLRQKRRRLRSFLESRAASATA